MFKSIQEVKESNKAIGHFWFSDSTMAFFASRVESDLLFNRYFVSSEKACFEDTTRVYHLRQVEENGAVNTLEGADPGQHLEFKSKKRALDYLNSFVGKKD